MSHDLVIRQAPPQEAPRQPIRAAGPDRVAGAAPPAISPEVGPPNPRLRMDRDLGMVVIEFRDAAGRVSTSLPSEKELQAYRASVNYGAELPSTLKPLRSGMLSFAAPQAMEPRPTPRPASSLALSVQVSFLPEGLQRSA